MRCAPAWMAMLVALAAGSAAKAGIEPVTSINPLADGVEVHSGMVTMRVTALREDIVRVRVEGPGMASADGSWAVLPSSREAHVAVKGVAGPDAVGFDTLRLRVRVERSNSALTISEADGTTILADAPDGAVELRAGGFRLRKIAPADEHYFGLGDKAAPLDRRGRAFTLWNTDAFGFQEGEDPLYKTIPYVMGFRAGHAFGLLLDNTFRGVWDFGQSDPNELSFGADGGPIDYYVLDGPAPKAVTGAYAWLTGHAPLPPLWSLGFQQSRYSYMSDGEVRALARRFRHERIPADAIWLDIDYQDRNRPFTVNARTFPDFRRLLGDLGADGFHLILITDLHIARTLDDPGYAPYANGLAGDDFLHNPDGSIYSGVVWPGPAVFPDFTRASARKWWGELYRPFYEMGASGFWNDMNEPALFATSTKTMPLDIEDCIEEPGFTTRTTTQREVHNVYGMENSRATYEGLLAIKPERRPFVMTRASYAGGQRFAVTWTGDNSSTWNHLRLSTPMLLSLGLSGFVFAGDDLGGFAGSPSPELLTRWLELGMFNPIARDHTEKGSNPQEPWVDGPAQTAIRRRYIEERYRMLPYNYTVAEEASRTGTPMMRPLFLEFPDADAGEPLDLIANGEFLWGPDLLVAPEPFAEQPAPYRVTLPPGVWYDYWTGVKVAEAPVLSRLQVTPDAATLPVYVRGGSIVPSQPLVQFTGQLPKGPLRLDVYPGPDCQGAIYQDAGDGFTYRNGDFYRATFRCGPGEQGLRVWRDAVSGGFRPWWAAIKVVVHDQVPCKSDQAAVIYDRATRTATFTVSEAALAMGVVLRP